MHAWLSSKWKTAGFALRHNDGPDGSIDFAGQYERQCGSLAHSLGSTGKSTWHDPTFLNSDRASNKCGYQPDSKDCCGPFYPGQ
jgi:hypothetical protein